MKYPNYLCIVAALLIATASFFTSCKKGDTGPAGTANVIYSDWMDVTYTPIKNTAGDTTYAHQAQIDAPKLTNDILNSGDVKVYVNINTAASPTIVPLPVSDHKLIDDEINVYFAPQKINLLSFYDESTFTNQGNKYYQYRYIIIPGGVKANASINWNNYEEVKQATGLKD